MWMLSVITAISFSLYFKGTFIYTISTTQDISQARFMNHDDFMIRFLTEIKHLSLYSNRSKTVLPSGDFRQHSMLTPTIWLHDQLFEYTRRIISTYRLQMQRKHVKTRMWVTVQRDGRPLNIGGALHKSVLIPFLAPHRKVWLTPTARVPCSNGVNIGECKSWTQIEFCISQNFPSG